MKPSHCDNFVLLLLSFVAVEYVISQVQFIIEITGMSAFEESLKTSVMGCVYHYPNSI